LITVTRSMTDAVLALQQKEYDVSASDGFLLLDVEPEEEGNCTRAAVDMKAGKYRALGVIENASTFITACAFDGLHAGVCAIAIVHTELAGQLMLQMVSQTMNATQFRDAVRALPQEPSEPNSTESAVRVLTNVQLMQPHACVQCERTSARAVLLTPMPSASYWSGRFEDRKVR